MQDNNQDTSLTEKEAATAYARAWNRLDCKDFIKLLAKDAHYASQYVLSELESQKDIEKYLGGKMQTIKETRSNVRAEIGRTTLPNEQACVLIYQNDPREHAAVVVFKVEEGYIKRFDLCMPQLYQVEKSGIFPV